MFKFCFGKPKWFFALIMRRFRTPYGLWSFAFTVLYLFQRSQKVSAGVSSSSSFLVVILHTTVSQHAQGLNVCCRWWFIFFLSFGLPSCIFSFMPFHSIYITILPVVLCTYLLVLAHCIFHLLCKSVSSPPGSIAFSCPLIPLPLWVGNFIMDSYSLSNHVLAHKTELPLAVLTSVHGFLSPFCSLFPLMSVVVFFFYFSFVQFSVCVFVGCAGVGFIPRHRVLLLHGLIILALVFEPLKS